MPYRPLSFIDDEAQAQELGKAIQLVQYELASSRYMPLANERGVAYVNAIAQDVLDRCCPHRGYRVSARYVPGTRTCILDLEQYYENIEL